jgi:hypothetical protein
MALLKGTLDMLAHAPKHSAGSALHWTTPNTNSINRPNTGSAA